MINLSTYEKVTMKKDFLMTCRLLCASLCILSACVPLSTNSYAQSANNSLTAQASRSVDFTYNELGLLTRIDGPRTDIQDITSYEYDSQGRLTKTTNALGHITEILAYSALGEPLSIKDENGIITTLTYNGFGWLTSVEVNSRVTSFEYDALAQITKTTLPNNSFIKYEYDDAHRLTAISDNEGNRVEYQLDLAGNRLKTDIKNTTGTLTSTQQNIFDELSRLHTSTNGVGVSTTYDYNKNDILTKQTDALSNITQYNYDALSRLTKTIDANNGETDFAYDNANRLNSITDAENKTTQYNYNNFDERAKRLSPDSGTTQYAYDETGNLTIKTDARGVSTQYQYDAISRLAAITYTNAQENISFSYDDTTNNKGIGKLTQVDDNSGQANFTYDVYGQLTNENYQINKTIKEADGSQSYQITYQYSNNSVVSSITYPSGRKVNFTLNSLGLIDEINTKSSNEAQNQIVISNVSYLPFGPVSSFTYGNGLNATRAYDLDYRITGDNLATLKQQTLTYSKVDNIASITDTKNTANNQTFYYDKLSQLKSASGDYGGIAFTYDKIGNRLTKVKNIQTDNYNYLEDNHRLTSVNEDVNSATPRYISRFNQAGRLSQIISNNLTTHYLYNYRGLRTAKFNSNENTHYHYDANGLLIAESTTKGVWKKEYLYFNNKLVVIVDYTNDNNGLLYYVHTDYLGTPKLATNATKAITWQASYTPFGLGTVSTDVDNDTNHLILNHRFLGQYYDVESQLQNNWFRYYDPMVGRYVSVDPIGIVAGSSVYNYVESNPSNFVDLDGKKRIRPIPIRPLNPGNNLPFIPGRNFPVPQQSSSYNPPKDNYQDNSQQCPQTDNDQDPDSDECKRLRKRVYDAKVNIRRFGKGKASCKEGMSYSQLWLIKTAWLELATARSHRDQKCYGGGDDSHLIAHRDAWVHVGKCEMLMKKAMK
jgi:RHS repeat-associated protein